MPKIINPAMSNVVANGWFRANGQPQQIPRSTSMPAVMAAPYGIAELNQIVAAKYNYDIKDVQDENP